MSFGVNDFKIVSLGFEQSNL